MNNHLGYGPGNLRHDAEAAAGVQDQGEETEGVLQLRRRQSQLHGALQKSEETGQADIIALIGFIGFPFANKSCSSLTCCEKPGFTRNTQRL